MSSSLQQLASNLVHKGKITLEEYNQTYEGAPLPFDKLAVNSEPTDKIVITDKTFNSLINKGTTMNTTSTFASISAQQRIAENAAKVKQEGYKTAVASVRSVMELAGIILCEISPLTKQLSFGIKNAAGQQLIRYIKKDIEAYEQPVMSIASIRKVESETHCDLLQNTLDFLNVGSIRELTPRRPQVTCTADYAVEVLLSIAITGLKRHPDKGYAGLDGAIATKLNELVHCGLPVREEVTDRVYEWDVDPFQAEDEASRIEDRSNTRDESYDWDDAEPEEERTLAVAGIHF